MRTTRPTFLYSLFINLSSLIWTIPAVLFALWLPSESLYLKYSLLGLAILWYVYRVALVRSRRYYLGEEQLVYRRGIFSIATDYLELYRVKDYREDRPFLMRLINTMKVTLITSDRSDGIISLEGIPSSNITRLLRELVEVNRRAKRVYEVD